MLRIMVLLQLMMVIVHSHAKEANVVIPSAPESFRSYIPVKLENDQWSYGFVFLSPALQKMAEVNKGPEESGNAVMKVMINNKSISIQFDAGMSDDPAFVIQIKGTENIHYLGGTEVFISENGSFYTSTRMNQDYQKRQKYILSDTGLHEVAQAYYLVDSKCSITEPTKLYSLPCEKGNVVATIPQGGNVNVLVHNPQSVCPKPQYLISTSFGLVGWVGAESGGLQK